MEINGNIIKVNLVCQLNSFIANLSNSNDLVDKIKMAKETNEDLK